MVLKVKHVKKRFGKQTVLKDITFSLEPKTCTALIGPNGAGKTTLLRMLSGLLKPTEGSIAYETKGDFRRIIGYLPQYPQFYEWMTAKEFLTFAANIYGLGKNETENRVRSLLEKTDLVDAKHKQIRTFSGGMKQRLGLAQALIHQPKILFLDEPVASLDPIGRRDVLTFLKQLKHEMTILFSTHILNDAEEVSDRVIILKDGTIIEQGALSSLEEKYALSKIILRMNLDGADVIKRMKRLPSIQDIEKIGDFLHLYVTSLDDAQKELFSFIEGEGISLIEYRIGRLTMEELFVKAVNE